MISIVVASLLAQTGYQSVADQNMVLKITTVGTFGTPAGFIEDPILNGDLEVRKTKEGNNAREMYRMKLSLKRNQSKLVEALTEGLPEQKERADRPSEAVKNKDLAFLVHSYRINPKDYRLGQYDSIGDEYQFSPQVLNPISLTLEIAQLVMTKPALRKEFPLSDDGPRKFFVTFKPNLNANTDDVPGDVAYKFDIKLKDDQGTYPTFFTGAIRLNTGTRKIQYVTASSAPDNQPKGPEDSFGGSEGKSYTVRLDAKPEKQK